MSSESFDRRRWARICAIIAVLYGLAIAGIGWWQFPTERKIASQTAANAIWALQQHESKYRGMPAKDVRRRLYRGLSDEQVTARVREYAAAEEQRVAARVSKFSAIDDRGMMGRYQEWAGGGDQLANSGASLEPGLRPTIAVLMDDVEKKHARRLESLKQEQLKTVALGGIAWIVPLVALYVVGSRWPRKSKRRRHR